MKFNVNILFQNTISRYLFAIAAVASVFALRVWLVPLTGTGAPYVLFFAAVLVTSLFAGVGPAICGVLLSMPLGAYTFVVGAGYSISQAFFQSLLFAVDGAVVIYLTSLIKKGRQATQDANRQLYESEQRFRLTIDEAPIGMALEALDGRFVRVNRALCEIVGYSADELTGLTFQAITHPDDLDADLALKGQLARGEISRYQLGKRYIRKDGAIVDIQLACSILRSREGAPLYYIAQIEDISDRQRAEAALKDSERRLALALDSAQMGMWDLDLLTDTSVRSLRHDQIFGYSAAVPTWGAAVFMTHVVPEDREVAKRAFEKAFVSDNFDMECRILWADESIHWISAKGRVYRNPKGDPVRMLGTVVDVTEQKRAKEALQRSEREFRELAESMPQIVWATRADGKNIYFNQQWVDYTGLTFEESYGDGWITPFHPDDRQRAWGAWQRATKHRDIYSLECRLRRADGVYRWWLIRGVPVLNANGEVSKWFGTCTDIDHIKVAERRLKESEAKFSGIISIAADAIISIDEEQRITIFNNGAEQVFGYSQAEVIGSPLDNLIPERFRKIHRQHVERFASGPVTARRAGERLTTIVGLRKNGEEFPVEAAISKLQVGDKTLLTVAMRDITERKQAEEALRMVSAELRHTLYTAGIGLTHCSRDLRYLSANPAYAEWIGLPLEQIIGRPIVEVMGPAAFEIIRPRIETVLSGERVEYEDELPIAGERKRIHVVYTPDRDPSGTVVGWVGSITDVTARYRIEEGLRAANAFLDAIIENIPLMLFIKESRSLRFIRVNRTGEDLLGWPNQTLIGKTAYDFWPKEQAEFFIEKDREALTNGSVVDIPEEPIRTRHHGVRMLHTKKVPILDAAGNPLYLLGLSEDITERKRIEQEQRFLAEAGVALSASLEYEQTVATVARLVVQHVADWAAVDVMDEEGRLSRLIVASADPDQAALCAALEQLPPDRDLPHLMRSVIESKRPIVVEQVTSEYIESLAQGAEHLQALLVTGVASFVAVPLLMRGQPLGALFLGSSTPSHIFGQGDLRWAEALADRAAVAIENARLYRAAVHASQLRDQVLGVVAHDLRNPLSAILLQTSALKRQGPKLERRSEKPMEVIHRGATRMNRLIQDLLDVARMEAGQLTIDRARLSAGGLIAEAVDMQRSVASSSSLELRAEVDPDVAEVWGDQHRLLQVFENLIGNAIKFTQPGGRITAGATSRDDEVVFWVADTGCGIPSENLPRVFDRFWQATRTGRQGAGLGLPITKGIVEAHGGRIWVESTAGSGSTFFFTIPSVSAAQDGRSDGRRPARAA